MSEWFYMYGGQQQGPVTGSQLKSMAATGGLGPDDLVWNQSLTDWSPARRVRGLTFATPAPVHQSAAPAPIYTPEQAPPEETYSPLPAAAMAEYPAAAAQPAPTLNYSQPSAEGVSPRTLDLLRQTRPWVLLISVLMFIGMGLMLLVAAIGAVALMAGTAAASRSMGGGSAPVVATAVGGVVLFVIVALYAVLLFFPAMFLMKYASAISRLTATRRVADLEAALSAQKSYWKFMGILALVGISLYALSFLLTIVGAAMH